MKKNRIGQSLLISALASAPAIAIMYLARQLAGLSFTPFELFNWVTRVTPGPLITIGIDLMIDSLRLLGINVADTAKTAERISAVLLFFGIMVVVGTGYLIIRRRRLGTDTGLPGWTAAAVMAVPMIAVSLSAQLALAESALLVVWLVAIFLGWGTTLERAARAVEAPESPESAEPDQVGHVERIDRRRFLVVLGASSATITLIGSGLGAILANQDQPSQTASTGSSGGVGPQGDSLPNSDDPVSPAPGTRPEYTPVEDHYRVFIQTEPTVIEESSWTLPIEGLVANSVELTLDQLRNDFTRRDQYVTLSCISGRIATSLISTTKWSGVSLQEILDRVEPLPDARYLYITSGDGFYETVDLDLIRSDERLMLAYDWDDRPIPVDHGFPLRIWIPDRYGMKQPKWITGIEVTDEYREGYWVERSWDEVARMQTTSVIDTVAVNSVLEQDGASLIPMGGIAHAGVRGISKVEVRVDEGEWVEANLRTPLSEATWVIWRYDWPFTEGRHTIEVRCVDGTGTPQIEEMTPSRPDGSTGIHSVNQNV